MENINSSGGLDIEEIIAHIIEADKAARASMSEAEDIRKNADYTIAERKAEMRKEYAQQAERRITLFEEFERTSANDEFTKSHQSYERQLKMLEDAKTDKFDGWVDQIVSRVLS